MSQVQTLFYSTKNFQPLYDLCKQQFPNIEPTLIYEKMQQCYQKYESQILNRPGSIDKKIKALNQKVIDMIQLQPIQPIQQSIPNPREIKQTIQSPTPQIEQKTLPKANSTMWLDNHLGAPAFTEIPTSFLPPPQPGHSKKTAELSIDNRLLDLQKQSFPPTANQTHTIQTSMQKNPFTILEDDDDILERESIASDIWDVEEKTIGSEQTITTTTTTTEKTSLPNPTHWNLDDSTLQEFLQNMNKEPMEYLMDKDVITITDNNTIDQNPLSNFQKPTTESKSLVGISKDLYSSAVSKEPTLQETMIDTQPNSYHLASKNAFPNAFEQKMELAPTKKVIEIDRIFYVDSRDRNLAIYPDPTNFVLSFAPMADTKQISTFVDSYENPIAEVKQDYVSQDRNAFVQLKYNNIVELQCVSAILPFHETYVCGNSPSLYNSAQYDENKIMSANQFTSHAYGPIYNDPELGYVTNILEEPYLLLTIDELTSMGTNSRDGTNDLYRKTFAKLVYDGVIDTKGKVQRFIKFKPVDYDYLKFYPTTLATLDKFTFRLETSDYELANVGIDKMFIRAVVPGSPLKPGAVVKSLVGQPSTRFYVLNYSNQYPGTYLYSHQLLPGDTLYFYNIYPKSNQYSICSNQIVFESVYTAASTLPNPINVFGSMVTSLPDPLIMIRFEYTNPTSTSPQPYYSPLAGMVQVNDFFRFTFEQNGSRIVEQCQVVWTFENYYIMTKFLTLDVTMPYTVLEIAYANPNLSGYTSESKEDLFYRGGWCSNLFTTAPTIPTDPYSTNLYVDQLQTSYPQSDIEPDSTLNIFEINFPYSQIQPYIQQNYFPQQIFFINKKKQVSYTMRVKQQIIESKWGSADIVSTTI